MNSIEANVLPVVQSGLNFSPSFGEKAFPSVLWHLKKANWWCVYRV